MTKLTHLSHCNCHSCTPTTEQQAAITAGRRNFLRTSVLGGLGMFSAPFIAGTGAGDGYQLNQITRNNAVKRAKAQHITILNTADIHAQLLTHDEFFWQDGKAAYHKRGGMAVLKTMIDTLRAENPANTIVIDGGDCFQGGGVAALSEGAAIVPIINHIGYDLMLPGNWEVVYGKEMMRKDLGAYDADKICANMYHDTADEFSGDLIFPPYWTKMVGGVKIGFIGYNDPLTPKRQSPAYSEGIRFTKPETNVAKYIKLLRNYEKCAMVFLVTHMGLAQQVDLANKPEVEGATYILGADTHERVRKPIQGKYALVTEPGAFGSFVARLDIVVEDGIVKDHSYQLLDVNPDVYAPNPDTEALVQKLREPYRKELDTVIGYSKTPLVRYYVMETPMDNLITDAIMWKFKPDIAVSNGFRFCPPLLPDEKTGKAAITNDFLWSMLPVNSEAKRGEVTGQQLWDWLEKELHNVFAKDPAKRFGGWVIRFKGMEVNFTMHNEMGKRLNKVKIGGKPINMQKTYTIVACERDGDPDDTICRIEKVQNPTRLNALLHDIVREYLAKFSPVAPKIEGRCTATDASPYLLSQLEGYDYEFR